MNEVRLIGGLYVDDNRNVWDSYYYTAEQAEEFSKTLIDCHNCSECHNCRCCRNCDGCSDCSYCRNCDGFSENPQRIFGWKMGRRGDVPAVYWIEPGKEQCVVGCFRGTLDQLEAKVKETHQNNPEHLKNYLTFIRNVRAYQEACIKNRK